MPYIIQIAAIAISVMQIPKVNITDLFNSKDKIASIGGTILPEIGYHIAKAHQRRGYAKEAAQAVRDWTFAHTPFGMVYSYMKQSNLPSAAVARANGMTLLREYTDAEQEQTAIYGISRADWETRNMKHGT